MDFNNYQQERYMHYGIDFGTTNSIVSFNDDEKVKILDIDTDETGKPSAILKSVIFFDKNGEKIFGQEAINRYIDNFMNGRLIRSAKTLLREETFSTTSINGKPYSAEDLVTIILTEIKRRADARTGISCSRATIGRPVEFSNNHRQDQEIEKKLQRAALRAGFEDIKIVEEPVGAGLAFLQGAQGQSEKIILIVDIGGGTSDFCLLKYIPNDKSINPRFQIIGSRGVYIGGDTLDSIIMWEKLGVFFGKDTSYTTISGINFGFPIHIANKLKWWHLVALLRERKTRHSIHDIKNQSSNPEVIENLEYLIDSNNALALFRVIEQSKVTLSTKKIAQIIFDDLPLPINTKLEQHEFENMVQGKVREIIDCFLQLLRAHSIQATGIDQVVCTGGTTKVPLINQAIRAIFSPEKIIEANTFTSVAYGLGLLH